MGALRFDQSGRCDSRPVPSPTVARTVIVQVGTGPTPYRVSTIRFGTAAVKPAGLDPEYHPDTSTTTWASMLVWMHTEPSVPIGAVTLFGTNTPAAVKLTLDANGCGVPHGQTVAKPGPLGWTMVTLSATADASAGMTWVTPP